MLKRGVPTTLPAFCPHLPDGSTLSPPIHQDAPYSPLSGRRNCRNEDMNSVSAAQHGIPPQAPPDNESADVKRQLKAQVVATAHTQFRRRFCRQLRLLDCRIAVIKLSFVSALPDPEACMLREATDNPPLVIPYEVFFRLSAFRYGSAAPFRAVRTCCHTDDCRLNNVSKPEQRTPNAWAQGGWHIAFF